MEGCEGRGIGGRGKVGDGEQPSGSVRVAPKEHRLGNKTSCWFPRRGFGEAGHGFAEGRQGLWEAGVRVILVCVCVHMCMCAHGFYVSMDFAFI